VWLSQLLVLEGYELSDVTGVIIGTVVPRALHNLQVLASKYFKTDAVIAGQGKAEWGFQLDVEEPSSSAPIARSIPSPRMPASRRPDHHRFRHRYHLRRGRL
jgi:hypothetical protein